jgi:hypothetical protein
MILISPWSKNLGKENAKNYPFWPELVARIQEDIVQIGVSGEKILVPDFRPNLPHLEIVKLLKECRIWIGIDNFLQHLNHYYLKKHGVVLWAMSDPAIFGYVYNDNILKSRDNLRPYPQQYWPWNGVESTPEMWVDALSVSEIVKKI